MQKFALAGAALAGLATQGFAQTFHLNEIYASHAGADTEEFIELFGTPNASLNGIMVLIVEGQASSSLTGGLDRAWDLSAETMPGDGYFVLGDTAVANNDFDIGVQDRIENGTETFYLISTTDVAAVLALVDTDVDADDDLVTDIANMGTVTILDTVCMFGPTPGTGDECYDGAQTIGPDGNFFPAGIFRGDDYPNGWCTDLFLDFSPGGNQTPGAANVSCPTTEPGSGFCDGSTGFCPCAAIGAVGQGCPNDNPNGNGALLVGTGTAAFSNDTLSFSVSDAPANRPGIMIQGANAISYPNGNPNVPNSSGLFCVNPTQRGFVLFTDGNGDATAPDFQGQPYGSSAQPFGSTTYYQFWFRDSMNSCQNPPMNAVPFNFSNGYEIDWVN